MSRSVFELSGHDVRLQSLRGLAALAVLVGHATLLCPPTMVSTLVGAAFEQDSAVIFFYVLSGFVLSAKLRRERFVTGPNVTSQWVTARALRLLPVFWTSIIFAAVVAVAMRHPPIVGASSWFNDNFLDIDVSWRTLAQNFLAYSVSINGTLWSVQVELCAIAFLPPIVMLIDRLSLRANLLVLAALLVISHQVLLPWAVQSPSLLARSVAYIYCFYLGALLPYLMVHEQARDVLPNGALVLIGLACAMLLRLAAINGLASFASKYVADALISVQIVAYVAGRVTPVDRMLLWPPIVRLGDISYSFYALGQPTLVGCAFVLFMIVPEAVYRHPIGAPAFSLASGLLAFAVLWPLATLSHRALEVGLRRRLTLALLQRPAVAVVEVNPG
jgi:peptidoglycan/LPS O-acetylase OafA/YrhL